MPDPNFARTYADGSGYNEAYGKTADPILPSNSLANSQSFSDCSEKRSKAAGDSTCRKRVTVCALFDSAGTLIACESNRCSPPGECVRMGVVQDKGNYDIHSTCNWEHAEIRTLAALKPEDKPVTAVLYGHDFYCDACEKALRDRGVINLVIQTAEGCGPR